ncbi:hypothetical protein EJ04DRAFT_247117 [Polyplosphaeria fusca]|uniref:Uncharacterized protein n=1 Tax=Polyplosphaeria fusca TaxID=682080 RepID=A0A9P4V195_9PLEO|nr:hypothetical protein EJ04DRAFT_247117 [Polyplosphaeria fusca]
MPSVGPTPPSGAPSQRMPPSQRMQRPGAVHGIPTYMSGASEPATRSTSWRVRVPTRVAEGMQTPHRAVGRLVHGAMVRPLRDCTVHPERCGSEERPRHVVADHARRLASCRRLVGQDAGVGVGKPVLLSALHDISISSPSSEAQRKTRSFVYVQSKRASSLPSQFPSDP